MQITYSPREQKYFIPRQNEFKPTCEHGAKKRQDTQLKRKSLIQPSQLGQSQEELNIKMLNIVRHSIEVSKHKINVCDISDHIDGAQLRGIRVNPT